METAQAYAELLMSKEGENDLTGLQVKEGGEVPRVY